MGRHSWGTPCPFPHSAHRHAPSRANRQPPSPPSTPSALSTWGPSISPDKRPASKHPVEVSGSALAGPSWPRRTGEWRGVFGRSSQSPAVSVFTDGVSPHPSLHSYCSKRCCDPVPKEHGWDRDDPAKSHPLSRSFDLKTPPTGGGREGQRKGGRVSLRGAGDNPGLRALRSQDPQLSGGGWSRAVRPGQSTGTC